MKRLVFIVFIVVAIALCFIFFNTEFFYKNSDSITRAKTVIPTSNGEISKSDKKIENYTDDVAFVSLIPWKSDETVINIDSLSLQEDVPIVIAIADYIERIKVYHKTQDKKFENIIFLDLSVQEMEDLFR